eukprot:TRINITY_DN25174_c0_g2_i1.p1 TRINITY_DN25174_c0_g2~~TRINITY_DN25174_c0_g2_i1.p1  ORF type:complete len:654 (-),score=115.89 TRINITY_DN25174_c0_g2_i1:259-2220(-)
MQLPTNLAGSDACYDCFSLQCHAEADAASDLWKEYLHNSQLAAESHVAAQTKLTEDLVSRLSFLHGPEIAGSEPLHPAFPDQHTPAVGRCLKNGVSTRKAAKEDKRVSFRLEESPLKTDKSPRKAPPQSEVLQGCSLETSLPARLCRHEDEEPEFNPAESLPDFRGLRADFLTDSVQEMHAATEGFAHRTNLHLERSEQMVHWTRKVKTAIGESTDRVPKKLSMHLDAVPPKAGFICRVVQSSTFQILSGAVIVLHTVFMIAGTNAAMREASNQHQQGSANLLAGWSDRADRAFLVFYVIEVTLRLYVYRLRFFCNDEALWNMLDLLLVGVSLFGLLKAADGDGNDSPIRVLAVRNTRMFKLAKLLRLVRAMRFFNQMHLFVDIILGCCESLFWAVMMILLILLLFAIYFVEVMENWMRTHWSPEASEDVLQTVAGVKQMFGSVEGAMLTLGMTVTGGMNWETSYAIAEQTGHLNAFVFLCMVAFFFVAMWNIVASVFIENTIQAATVDRDDQIMARHRTDVQDAKELMALCQMADVNMSGTLSAQEFEDFMNSNLIREFFLTRGLDIKNAAHFFEMMNAVGEGDELELEHFVGTCLRVKGVATSIDLHMLAFEHKVMSQKMKKFIGFVHNVLMELSGKMDAVLSLQSTGQHV